MRKKIALIASVMSLAGLFSGCGGSPEDSSAEQIGSSTEQSSEEKETRKEETGSEVTEAEKNASEEENEGSGKTQIQWAVQPFLKADRIVAEDKEGDKRARYVSLVKEKDLTGFIRYDGCFALEPMELSFTPDFYSFNYAEGNVGISIGSDGELQFSEAGGFGTPFTPSYYYYAEKGTVYENLYGYHEYTGDQPVIAELVSEIHKEGNDISDMKETDRFGIVGSEGIILDCVYEDGYMTGFKGEKYCVLKKNGKWGYYTVNGEQLTEHLYESFPGHMQGDYFSTWITDMEYTDHIMPYYPTEGYIAIRTQEGCGYIDVKGKEIYPVGTFEDVCPVHGGKAWAKQDGLWGVLDLPRREEAFGSRNGWQKTAGDWYYFDPETGESVTGWKKISGKWYYFESFGEMVTGLQMINNKWYYFSGNGDMLEDQTIGSFTQDYTGETVGGIRIGKNGEVEYIECATQSRNRYKVRLYPDGTAKGSWESYDHDTSEQPHEWDTVIKFHGDFSHFQKYSDNVYTMKLESMEVDSAETITREKETKEVLSETHDMHSGLEEEWSKGSTFYLYLPGTQKWSVRDGFEDQYQSVCLYDDKDILTNCVLDNPDNTNFFEEPAGWR